MKLILQFILFIHGNKIKFGGCSLVGLLKFYNSVDVVAVEQQVAVGTSNVPLPYNPPHRCVVCNNFY